MSKEPFDKSSLLSDTYNEREMLMPSAPNTNAALPEGVIRWFDDQKNTWGTPQRINKISIGQSNPTFLITTEERQFILRSQPNGNLLPSAHAVDREYKVMSRLEHTDVPVPRMLALSDDREKYDVKFFLMEKINGITLLDPSLPDLTAIQRQQLYMNQIDVLSALSQLRPSDIGLSDFGRPDGYIDRQIATWTKQYRASATEHLPDMEILIEGLPGQFQSALKLPHTIIHGDFRLDNMIVSDAMNIAALIDWELSTLGPVFIDLSYWCAMLRMQHEWPISGLGGKNKHKLNIPEEETIINQFCTATGLSKPVNWEYWIAFQLFRFASILQGVKKRHLDGNASADNAELVGSQAAQVAQLGAEILQNQQN